MPEGKEGYPKRERYWLEQLQTFDRFPALFIMGRFRDLLRQSGVEVVEAECDWAPSDFVTDEMRS
jgi:hypothetical protein